jgi:hypothetical protein
MREILSQKSFAYSSILNLEGVRAVSNLKWEEVLAIFTEKYIH